MTYDPVKAHQYYERTKHLRGKKSGSPQAPPKVGLGSRVVSDSAGSSVHRSRPNSPTNQPKLSSAGVAARQRVVRLKAAVSKLQGALTEARAELSKKRAAAKQTAKENSDGKSTEAEKNASQKYRDKHQAEIASKRKASSSSSSGSSSSSSSSSSSTSSVSDMSVTELETRIIKIQTALTSAKSQLSKAQQELGQLAHSAITSEPMFQKRLARFLSAERRPSA